MNFNDLHQLFDFVKNLADVSTGTNGPVSAVDAPIAAATNHSISEPIMLKIMGLDNSMAKFVCHTNTRMEKVMQKYAELTGIQKNATRFRFDGHAIGNNDTPASLEMINGDIIEVYWAQTGGGSDNEASTSKQSSEEADWRSSENLIRSSTLSNSPTCCCRYETQPPRDFVGSY